MRHLRLVLVPLVLLGLLAAGCGVASKAGSDPVATTASGDGVYVRTYTDTGMEGQPVTTVLTATGPSADAAFAPVDAAIEAWHAGRAGAAGGATVTAPPSTAVAATNASPPATTSPPPTTAVPTVTETPPPTTVELPALVERVRSGVVELEVDTCAGRSTGSGFVLDDDLVATVEHVVAGAVRVRLHGDSGATVEARVVHADAQRDIALLRLEGPLAGHRFSLSTTPPRLGDDVVALGYPLGLPLSITTGTVSGFDRSVRAAGVLRTGLIQTDTALNPGNSGGPLVDRATGDVVGLAHAVESDAQNISFAVRSDGVAALLDGTTPYVAPAPVRCESAGPEPGAAVLEATLRLEDAYLATRATTVRVTARCDHIADTVEYAHCIDDDERRLVRAADAWSAGLRRLASTLPPGAPCARQAVELATALDAQTTIYAHGLRELLRGDEDAADALLPGQAATARSVVAAHGRFTTACQAG